MRGIPVTSLEVNTTKSESLLGKKPAANIEDQYSSSPQDTLNEIVYRAFELRPTWITVVRIRLRCRQVSLTQVSHSYAGCIVANFPQTRTRRQIGKR